MVILGIIRYTASKSQIIFQIHSLFRKPLFCSKTSRLPIIYSSYTFTLAIKIPFSFLSILPNQEPTSSTGSLATGPLPLVFVQSVLFCSECHLPIFQCPNAPCLLRYTAQCHFPSPGSLPHLEVSTILGPFAPVQPSGKVPDNCTTMMVVNCGGSCSIS